MIIAGEASGDLHGSGLVLALSELDPEVKLIGMGGQLMVKAGLSSFQDIKELSVIGLLEVLSNLGKFTAAFDLLVGKLESEKPDCVVLIDYPEFNLRFAKEAKKRGIPVVYYISPQIWAWRRGRIKTVKKYVDKMIVILGFEKEFYEKEGVAAEFVGHPLLDCAKTRFEKKEFFKREGLDAGKKTIVLLPGSRQVEVIRNLPVMLGASEIIKDRFRDGVQFIIAKPAEIGTEIYDRVLTRFKLRPKIIENYPYDCIGAADLALVASGTATLETAILEKPMIIIYRVSLLTWLFGRMLVKIPDIGLVNIVAGERIVPEFVQFDAVPKNIAGEAISFLSSPEKADRVISGLRAVKQKLGEGGAGKKAARLILALTYKYNRRI